MKVPTEAEMQAMRERLEIRGSSLWWKVQPSNVDMSKPAGYVDKDGYQIICLRLSGSRTLWFAHRVSYFLHHKIWPEGMLDHKDQDKQNNDPENLRLATASTNQQNTPAQINNALGIKGVCKTKSGYAAELVAAKIRYRKRFPTLEEAVAHRKYLEEKYHPFASSLQNVS